MSGKRARAKRGIYWPRSRATSHALRALDSASNKRGFWVVRRAESPHFARMQRKMRNVTGTEILGRMDWHSNLVAE